MFYFGPMLGVQSLAKCNCELISGQSHCTRQPAVLQRSNSLGLILDRFAGECFGKIRGVGDD